MDEFHEAAQRYLDGQIPLPVYQELRRQLMRGERPDWALIPGTTWTSEPASQRSWLAPFRRSLGWKARAGQRRQRT